VESINVADDEGAQGEDSKSVTPSGRGWFASSNLGDVDVSSVMLWGGLNGKNEREGNGWILTID